MDRFLTHSVCELRREASGRARFAARRGRGMKDHGRAQETVVIGVVRPLVIDLCRLLLGFRRGLVQRCCVEVLRFEGADSCQALWASGY